MALRILMWSLVCGACCVSMLCTQEVLMSEVGLLKWCVVRAIIALALFASGSKSLRSWRANAGSCRNRPFRAVVEADDRNGLQPGLIGASCKL
eukprot:1941098-Amphidinium_carterae.2